MISKYPLCLYVYVYVCVYIYMCVYVCVCVCVCVCVLKWKSLSHVQLFVSPWTVNSMEFSREEYWSR